jgi:outer membrane receptor for ferrienterochelin and colicin
MKTILHRSNNFPLIIGKLFLFLVFIVLTFLNGGAYVNAQKHTISGYIEDASTGERLIAATVYDEISKQGVVANVYGFYSLTLHEGPVKINYSYVGFQTESFEFDLQKDTLLKIALTPSVLLKEVVITSQKESQVEQAQMSVVEIPIQTIKSLPVFMGEKDILKAIQLFPGVQSGGEGTTGLYVRGGGPDQNLILLDGVPVYNADHLFGFFSVFNPDAIQHVSLIKGGFPARYGGRLSSVLDIRMKEGNNKETHGEFSVGLISSKLTVEGPIKKNKSSFIISARRTYLDILVQPVIKAIEQNTSGGYYFYDLNTKLNYILSDKDRIYLSMYMGKDRAYLKYKDEYYYDNVNYESIGKAGLDWGNITTALRWNHIYNKKWFSNVTATFSKFQFDVGEQFISKETSDGITQTSDFSFLYFSGIQDWAIRADFEYIASPSHRILLGASDIYHTFSPGSTIYKFSDASDEGINFETTYGNSRIFAHEISVYVEDELSVNARLKINSGIHASAFPVHGTTYSSVQPRLNVRYIIREDLSVKAAVSKMTQYILLLTNSGIGLPTDLWLPVTENIKPQQSWQYAAGIFHDINNTFEISLEGFYKSMSNLIEYREGADFFSATQTWQDKIVSGDGEAYGAEVLIRKNEGSTTGWIGYTLSWATRQFDDLNFGKPYPYRYDRRHDIGLAITHKLNDNIDFGLVWVFGTGNAVSLPIEKYPGTGLNPSLSYYSDIEYYDGRNGFRTPSYHRLDLGVNFHKQLKKGERTWSFNIYNVYNRKNPFMIYFSNEYDYFSSTPTTRLKQISLFPIIPSFSYSYKF